MADTQRYEILIHSAPEKVWDALTNGEMTKQYFFEETIVSDWKKGSPWHSLRKSGTRDVEGVVVEAEHKSSTRLTAGRHCA